MNFSEKTLDRVSFLLCLLLKKEKFCGMVQLEVGDVLNTTISLPDFAHSPIDIHTHFNHGSPFDCPETPVHLRGLDFIESMYRRGGVFQAGCSTYASVLQQPECVVEENEYMYRLIEQKEWVYQWVVVDPRQPETFAQAERMLEHPKVLGIKIHPTYHGYDILEYGDAIFSFADKHQVIVLMHPQHILEMPSFANAYPNMKLIIAHLGGEDHIVAVERHVTEIFILILLPVERPSIISWNMQWNGWVLKKYCSERTPMRSVFPLGALHFPICLCKTRKTYCGKMRCGYFRERLNKRGWILWREL